MSVIREKLLESDSRFGVPFVSGLAKPLGSLSDVPGGPFASAIYLPKNKLCFGMSLGGSLLQPKHSLGRIHCHPVAVEIPHAKRVLCVGVTLISRLPVPLKSQVEGFGLTLPAVARDAQTVLGRSIPLRGLPSCISVTSSGKFRFQPAGEFTRQHPPALVCV